jgi:hypothetical protein
MATRKQTTIGQITSSAAALLARPMGDNTVRVHVTPDVIYNFDKYRAVAKGVLDKIGCPECHSGKDIRFESAREFEVSPRGDIKAASLSSPAVAERIGGLVEVDVPPDALYDIAKLERITKAVLGKLGCDNCHSGYDIRYKTKSLNFVANKKLEVEAI